MHIFGNLGDHATGLDLRLTKFLSLIQKCGGSIFIFTFEGYLDLGYSETWLIVVSAGT